MLLGSPLQNNSVITLNELLNGTGIGFARNFGVVANEYDHYGHTETSLYVKKLVLMQTNAFTNTDTVYRDGLNYTCTVSKTGDASIADDALFNIALFTKGDDGSFTKVTGSEKTISKSSPVTYNLSDFYSGTAITNKTSFYVFELDIQGNKIDNGAAGNGYTVTYNSKTGNSIPNKTNLLNNTSYIWDFQGNMEGNTPFNSYENDPYIHFGRDVKVEQDPNPNYWWFANSDTYNDKNNGNKSRIFIQASSPTCNYADSIDQFPYDFDTLFTDLREVSSTLAALSLTAPETASEVRVIKVTATVYDSDKTKAYLDKTAWDASTSLSDNEKIKNDSVGNIILSNGQYAVVDVIVPDNVTNLQLNTIININGSHDSYASNASQVIYNSVSSDNTPYDKHIKQTPAFNGTFFAPSANVESGSSNSAQYIADVFRNGNEVHFSSFGVQSIQNYIAVNNSVPTKGWLSVTKVDETNNATALSGAVFNVYDNASCTGDPVTTIGPTAADGTAKSAAIAAGNYWVREKTAPMGYTLSGTIYPVTVMANTTVQVNSGKITNKVSGKLYSLTFTKIDSNNKPLSGATYALYRMKGNTPVITTDEKIGSYTTGTNGTVTVNSIETGEYYLKEEIAPSGHTVNPNITALFSVTDQNTSQSPAKASDQDAKIELAINKVDSETKAALAGAKLEITDENGTVMLDSAGSQIIWTSDGTVKTIDTTNFVAGKTYKLVELSAPSGYTVASAVSFTISLYENDQKKSVITINGTGVLATVADGVITYLNQKSSTPTLTPNSPETIKKYKVPNTADKD